MNFTTHPSNNGVLGAPAGWDQERIACDGLPVTCSEISGQQVVISYWQPSAEEIALLVAGKPVGLVVFGGTMPPVALAVTEG
ncbi:hypothetical protein [Herbaspirillum sp. B65]|uniref:hypothetical protein n=1 Tax=Herbaspirillum sp. B65 TaxID=137708 RepID=UPI0005C9F3B6|nr:hypothetical protein [Herbaspirillum sp. B65]